MGRDRDPLGPRMSQVPGGLRTSMATPEYGASAWLFHRAGLTPDAPAIVDGSRRLTYAQLANHVRKAAGLLHGLGVGRYDRIATLTSNCAEFVELFYATAELGAILVPLNFRLAAPELDYQIRDAGAELLFVGQDQAPLADLLAKDLPIRERIDFAEEYARRRDAAVARSTESGRAAFSDPHLILYTAGTTGHPKGAVLTHANTYWNVANISIAVSLTERDTTATILPMFHSGGIGLFTVPTLTVGGRVIVQRRFDPAELLDILRRERVAVCLGVPAIWLDMLKAPEFTAAKLPDLRYLASGGAPCPTSLRDEIAARGFVFLEGYGLTETSPGGTLMPVPDWRRKGGTVGKSMAFVELRVVRDDGSPCDSREIGEVQFRGPNVFAGYWNAPAATAVAFTADGWLRTGDLGFVDDEGFLTLVDRKKDMVITGGENVYSAEVEDVIFAHASVAEAAVIGVPDERWGEAVCAVVVLRPNAKASADELIAHCRARLAKYKTPKYVMFMGSLPRNAAGKVLKRQLREEVRIREKISS
jgi:fatty-acyl-CoA synthase